MPHNFMPVMVLSLKITKTQAISKKKGTPKGFTKGNNFLHNTDTIG